MSIHNRFVKPVIAVGAAAVLIVGVSACLSGSSGQGANPPSKSVKTLRWLGLSGTATWANTLDPAMVTDSISNGIIQMVDAGLVKLLPNGTPVADLAKSWTVSDHGMVYTFYLRPNLKFSNGDKLTANDVNWSIKRAWRRRPSLRLRSPTLVTSREPLPITREAPKPSRVSKP